MPADGSSFVRRAGALSGALAALQLTALVTAQQVFADPTPSPSCTKINIPVPGSDQVCPPPGATVIPGTGAVGGVTDPLGSLAKGCAQAAAWVVRKLSGAIDGTTQVDFTNAAFLQQYAVVFAGSTIVTLLLWLLAVTKRAVRGAPLTTAISEAVGFLWLTVVASAFTPLILYTVVSATDGLTKAIAVGTKSDTGTYLGGFADTLEKGTMGGGPLILIIVSLVAVLAAAVLWIELLIRAAMLYVGALLGTAVYAGLVDKQLWKHVRRWAGLMVAVDLAKPIIVIILGLAGAVATGAGADDDFARVLSGLAILFLSIFASAAVYRFVPGFGDEMLAMRSARASAVSAGSAMINGPANLVKQGISAHGSRGGPQTANASGPGGGSVSPGIAAHAGRTPAPPPQAPPVTRESNPAKGG
ncbi:hypothetical protein GCM10010193_43990 [Kitasatospora atroaurantiaca]|uniref:TrbL/VirB6 plasmid conjugal transfer protein n=1 Tax=Kitasatospora atroaurantiaca TaxID=285545 RepID=A0A561ETJ3_9ACTN|nr:hypothetical protein [Kitasatospora atroaurantiaca]TWE18932.1 hypothetical protein FB465_4033 [Kitasatospora atroaurantiaca]